MNTIKINLTFNEFEFRRVKPMGSHSVLYTGKDWIGREVCIIPLPYNITDKMVHRSKGDDGLHHLCIDANEIICKTVADAKQTGRIYVHDKWLGYDMLIVEAPKLEHF